MAEKARSCRKLMGLGLPLMNEQAVAPLSRGSDGRRAGPHEHNPRAAGRRISAFGRRCSAGRALKDKAGFVKFPVQSSASTIQQTHLALESADFPKSLLAHLSVGQGSKY